jgi:hypothetical protein
MQMTLLLEVLQERSTRDQWPIVKKVVRRAELLKGHPLGFQVSGMLLIEASDNP